MKLDVGSGDTPEPGFTTFDQFAPADVSGDMRDLPFPPGSVDAINCSHALEHLERKDVVTALEQFRRVLRRRGTLRVVVPDFDYACRQWLDGVGEDRDIAYRSIYGGQTRQGQYHLSGWDRWTLADAVEEAGFEVVKVSMEPSHGTVCVVVEAFVP